jgi:hypothetical protein
MDGTDDAPKFCQLRDTGHAASNDWGREIDSVNSVL